jgi:hypothetical protein
MLKNDAFRKQFIDTYCLVAGSVFEPERCENCNFCKATKKLNSVVSWDNLCNNNFTEDKEER